MFNEFKEFAIQGNVLDMAVGTMIGGAFGKIVTSLVNDILTPLLSLLLGNIDLSGLSTDVTVGETTISVTWGVFMQNVVDFLIMAVCIFAFVKFFTSLKKKPAEEPEEPKEPELSAEAKLLTEIKELLEKK
ncbi:MAG: large conductance mechanosensitive channel protein MscL [Erysipelotrichaceae bacterium]|nr:large conductance mechanosensitive channel protein MscL [Erysipelotrichaceae bacterium]